MARYFDDYDFPNVKTRKGSGAEIVDENMDPVFEPNYGPAGTPIPEVAQPTKYREEE